MYRTVAVPITSRSSTGCHRAVREPVVHPAYELLAEAAREPERLFELVEGAEEQNDILDAADVHTDFTGGIMGEGTGPANLIASAFADWKQSENGLVTVYDADGELLGNGNF